MKKCIESLFTGGEAVGNLFFERGDTRPPGVIAAA